MVSDTIAHDINNLLLIVAGSCERLVQQTSLTPAQIAELERISLATNHAAWLTSQLVATSRGTDASFGPTELGHAVNVSLRLLGQTLGDRIRVELHLAPRETWVPMTEGQVSQVLINLALNARDAMPEGGVFRISTGVLTLDETAAATHRLPSGDYVDLEIRDNGVGMTPDVAAHAFDRFFTTKPAGRGTGLGLSSVKRVIEWCGGTIDLRSLPGQGARFAILLPLIEAAQTKALPNDEELSTRARDGETVLVAEDEHVVREIVSSILRSLGYEVVEAGTAEQAIAASGARRIDLLLADIDLPDLSGMELATRIQTVVPGARVLFMSGYGDEGAVPPQVRQAAAFIQKPFTGRALGRKIRDVLDAPAGVGSTGQK